MKRVELGSRSSIMHAPRGRTCLYSGESLDTSEIAVTFSSDISGYTNSWLSLSSVSEFISELREIYTDPPGSLHDEEYSGDIDVIMSSMKGDCIMCNDYSSPYREDGFNGIVEFSEESDFRGSPYLHVNCIEDFIEEQLEVIPEKVDSLEVVSQRL